ncbi:MAG TPA: tetratricopeptide repeat protein [Lacunisphaera sp.]|nr:tetratricopeptide repeat protein [Lacunisphaera sp.]
MKLTSAIRALALPVWLMANAAPLAAALPVDNYELRRNEAYKLTDDQKPAEAEKALLTLLKERPNDGGVLFALGRVAMQKAGEQEGGKRRQLIMEMRDYLTRARAAGFDDPLITQSLQQTNPDGTENLPVLSSRKDLNKLLAEGEKYFEQRNFAKALEKYAEAFQQDPTSYIAALYAGDAQLSAGHPEESLEWFNRARAIEPDRETAHRYGADALMRLRRPDDALPLYVSAAVAEPYNGYPWRALNNYCQASLIKPWTAPREIPTASVTGTDDGRKLGLPEEFTAIDMAYGVARMAWQQEHRARKFPSGAKYRLTLEEEAYALDTALATYRELKRKPVEPGDTSAAAIRKIAMYLDHLIAIDDAGLLEAHILLVRGNAELA